ncbi:hypothetical protein D3C87_2006770 [compost metagenome]
MNVLQLSRERRDAWQVGRFTDHHRGTGIGDLMAQKLALERGVDRHAHGAELIDGQPGGDRIDIVIEHGQHGFTGFHAKRREGIGHLGRE